MENNVDESVDYYNTTISALLDRHSLIKYITFRVRRTNEWFDDHF